jgi:hypothetical protein
MAALTKDRQLTASKYPEGPEIPYPVEAIAVIYKGALVVVNADGYLEPATSATGKFAAGKAQEAVDNTGGADGDKTCVVRWGVHKWENSGSNTVVQADLYDLCYAEDDQTVGNDATGRSAAGRIVELESDGVWVLTDPTALA